jgi:hypothetical protein
MCNWSLQFLPAAMSGLIQRDTSINCICAFRRLTSVIFQRRKGTIHAGGTRRILENEFGNLPKDLPVEKFDGLVATLKAKIDNTALGRNNAAKGIRNYHSFEEHGTKAKK